MSNFSRKWGQRAAIAAACLLLVGSLEMGAAQAQDGFAIISDSFSKPSNTRRNRSTGKFQQSHYQRQSQAIRPTSGYCDVGSCDTGCCDSVDCGVGCDSGCCGECCCCVAPWWAHKSAVWGEFLYLQATDADVAHAQQQNGIGGAGTVPFGRIGTLSQDHQPGFRVGVEKCCSACSSIGFSYTYLQNDTVDSLAPPIVPGGGGAVGSLVHHPGAAITASVGTVNALYDVDFQLAEFEYRSIWKANDCWAINWSVGGRYGHLEQDFRQVGVFGGGAAGAIQTDTDIDFDGAGLKFGLDGERRLGCSGWSFYGRGNVSPLTGRFHANYRMNNNTTDVLLANAVWEDDRIVTLMNLEAGISWTGKCRRWRASAGYLTSYWFNTVTTGEFIDGVQANEYDNIGDTLCFDGLTARIERRW